MAVTLSLGTRRLLLGFAALGLFALGFDWITGAQYIELILGALRAAMGFA